MNFFTAQALEFGLQTLFEMRLKEISRQQVGYFLSKFLSGLTICALLIGAVNAAAEEMTWVNPLDRYSASCKLKVLNKLGWTIQVSQAVTEPQLAHDPDCYELPESTGWIPHNVLVVSPAQKAQIDGIAKPTRYGPAVLSGNDALNLALHADGSRCIFQQKYNRAIHSTINWLSYDPAFVFPFLTKKNIAMHVSYWHQVSCVTKGGNGGSNICYMPEQAHLTEAIEDLKWQAVAADCQKASDLTEYLAMARVFGPQFASSFSDYPWQPNKSTPTLNARFYLGDDDYESTSVLKGKYSAHTFEGPGGQITFDWDGLARASLGPQALISSMGEIENVYGRTFLDDPTNQSENFIIYDISRQAVRALQKMGGITGFDMMLVNSWNLAEQFRKEIGVAGQMYLQTIVKFRGNPFPIGGMPPRLITLTKMYGNFEQASKTYFELTTILNNQFLQGTKVYVHPLGVNSIAYYIARLAIQNPRTPFKMRFTYDNIHGEIFNRWIKTQLDQCEAR